jgi:multidrug efflux pump subunit AcrA (membrane-fusion protein)
MKRSLWTMLAISMALTITLTACGASPSAPPAPTSTNPAMPQKNSPPPSAGSVVASAVSVPEKHAQMSFAISAPVKEILVKKGDVVKAGQPLMVLSTLDLELAVKEAEWAVRSAQSLFDRAKDPYKKVFGDGRVLYAAGYVEKRQEMEARLQSAQSALDSAKYALAQGTLLAPFDGAIIDIDIEVGEIAQPGKIVIMEGAVAGMQIETTDLSERDVPAVHIGQTANVYIKPLDVTVTGKVVRVSPISETVGGDVVYPITVKLDEQPDGLLWGMSAEVEIQTK